MYFCGEYGFKISERKKIRENRIDERKKREMLGRDREREEEKEAKVSKTQNTRFDQVMPKV